MGIAEETYSICSNAGYVSARPLIHLPFDSIDSFPTCYEIHLKFPVNLRRLVKRRRIFFQKQVDGR